MLHLRARARRWEPTAPCQHWYSEHKYAPLPDILPLASISIFPSGVRTSLTNVRLSITLRHETQVRCGVKRFCFTAIFLANLTYRFCLGRRIRPLQPGYRRVLGELGNGAKLPPPGPLDGPPPPPDLWMAHLHHPGLWTVRHHLDLWTSHLPDLWTARRPDLFLSSHLCASCPWICCHRGRE